MSQIIKTLHRWIRSNKEANVPLCSCWSKSECPTDNAHHMEKAIYKFPASATFIVSQRACTSMTQGDWKQWHFHYKKSLKNKIYKNQTTSHSYLQELKIKQNELQYLCFIKHVPGYSTCQKYACCASMGNF